MLAGGKVASCRWRPVAWCALLNRCHCTLCCVLVLLLLPLVLKGRSKRLVASRGACRDSLTYLVGSVYELMF